VAEQVQGAAPAPFIVTEQTLRQAIISLLNNAADASPQAVEVQCEWDDFSLRMHIHDRGAGVSREVRERAGYDFFSTKPAGEGNGIGLLLARATIERIGGQVDLTAREGGGATTLVKLPLAALNPRRGQAAAAGAPA
jgi:two-component system, sensor histidine kinase RegB